MTLIIEISRLQVQHQQCGIVNANKNQACEYSNMLQTRPTTNYCPPIFSSIPVRLLDTSICDLLLLDVCPLGLGIEDIQGQMHTLIRRNTTIPTRTTFYSVFTNAYAYQTTATIRIFEGEHNLTKYNVCSV